MSKVFYDHLIVFDDLASEIKKIAKTTEERDELWQLVDELTHHRALNLILDRLPKRYHEEFLNKFHKAPYDTNLVVYLSQKIDKNIEELLRQELGSLAYEILREIKFAKK